MGTIFCDPSRRIWWPGVLWVLSLTLLAVMFGCEGETPKEVNGFIQKIIEPHRHSDPWGKSAGDLNGDARPDLIVGGHESRELVWYENPSWRRRVILKGHRFGTDIEVVDVDGDGHNDVLALTTEQLLWLRGPNWELSVIEVIKLHDIEFADFDGDGKIDIVGRNQIAFGELGTQLKVYLQRPNRRWKRYEIPGPDGEGLKVNDLDGDGDADIIVNGIWLENRGGEDMSAWRLHSFATTWKWNNVFIDAADIDGDGSVDLVLSPSEPAGGRHRISWFSRSGSPVAPWKESVIANDVETVHHFVAAVDMDNDQDTDIVTAAMHQGTDPDEVVMYVNENGGREWSKRIIGRNGSHSMRVLDVDGDSDWDLFGANWSGDNQEIVLWENSICPSSGTGWVRHEIDSAMPWRAVFVDSSDIDGDGYTDVVAGAWWYRNPGNSEKDWERITIGAKANSVVAVLDIDGDSRPDILATDSKGAESGSEFVWARNSGAGAFQVERNVANSVGDFLQGVAIGRFTSVGRRQIALSWHAPNNGVRLLTIPERVDEKPWTLSLLSQYSQDEALSAGDIDSDGDQDLLLGTVWLQNNSDHWIRFRIANTSNLPDRNVLADIDGDGRLDAVVGFEAISEPGTVAWYRNVDDSKGYWEENSIATVVGPMSLGVGDMDGDGDNDVVVGEHNLNDPDRARMLVFENVDGSGKRWAEHTVYTGDEHHDGSHLVDIDNDNDLDIVSIGWGHDKIVLYENRIDRCVQNRFVR